jgi:RNA polymerase sigma factor for flagellar operon FliA
MDIKELWKIYLEKKDENSRNELITKYQSLVKSIAVNIYKKLPSNFELEDLISDGTFGLIKAIETFDPNRGAKFETYANTVVRGSVLNGLRAMDWVPERTRGRTRALQKAMEKFSVMYGRAGTANELAQELETTAEEVYELINEMGTSYLLSLDQQNLFSDDDENFSLMDVVKDNNSDDPFKEVEFKDIRIKLKNYLTHLDKRDQHIVQKHYFEGVNFETIAKELKISKQRISQMHSRAIKKLRELMIT